MHFSILLCLRKEKILLQYTKAAKRNEILSLVFKKKRRRWQRRRLNVIIFYLPKLVQFMVIQKVKKWSHRKEKLRAKEICLEGTTEETNRNINDADKQAHTYIHRHTQIFIYNTITYTCSFLHWCRRVKLFNFFYFADCKNCFLFGYAFACISCCNFFIFFLFPECVHVNCVTFFPLTSFYLLYLIFSGLSLWWKWQ